MSSITILENKSFIVGRRKVKVLRQDEVGSDKPHQVQIVTNAKGIKMVQTTSYPEGSGNADCDYAEFDQAKADKHVAKLLKFIGSKKGKALVEGPTTLDRTKLSTAATYAQLVDSLTQYGGTNNATTHNYGMPADGIFRVSREHYDPDATPDDDILYSGDSDDQTNNVQVNLAFAVDWQRLKLLLADAEYDLAESGPRWTDTETWIVMGDGFQESLCLCRFTEKHVPKEEVGVCFLAEWE